MYAQGEDDRLAFALARSDGGNMEGWRFVSFAHVTGPLRMEMEAALNASLFRFGSFEAAVARIDVTLEDDFGIGKAVGVHRASFHETHRRALHRAGHTDFIAALRQDDIIETCAREECPCGRQAEVHGDRHHL